MRRGLTFGVLSLAALAGWPAPRADACWRVDFIAVAIRSPVSPCGPVIELHIRRPILRARGGPGILPLLRRLPSVVVTPPGPQAVVPPAPVPPPPMIQVPPGAPPVVLPPPKN